MSLGHIAYSLTMLTALTTNVLLSVLLVWSLSQHAADGRYVDADDFTTLAAEVAAMKEERRDEFTTFAAEVAAMKEERLVFSKKIMELEIKLGEGEAKLKVVEETLSITEIKVIGTEEKLRDVEGQLNDALARIDELERNSELPRDQDVVTTKETYEEDRDHETDMGNDKDTNTPIIKTDGIRDRSANGSLHTLSKRILPAATPHIAFSAYLNAHLTNLGNQHLVKFDGVNLNQGNGYDAILGVFICPVSGVYMFQSALMSAYHDYIETEIVKDGALLVRLYATGFTYNQAHDQGFNSVITSCNKGEHIWVRVSGTAGTAVNGGRFSTFSGYLLWES